MAINALEISMINPYIPAKDRVEANFGYRSLQHTEHGITTGRKVHPSMKVPSIYYRMYPMAKTLSDLQAW